MTEQEVRFGGKYPSKAGYIPGGEHPARDNTPDAGGYALAVLVSWVLISVGLALAETMIDLWPGFRVTSVDLEFLVIGTLIWGYVSSFFAVLTAPVGVVLVHRGCRHIRNQWVHVVVTAVVGGLAVYAVALVFGEAPRDWDKVAAGVGLCTAVGRAAVIPLVPAVRRRRLARHSFIA